MIQKILHSQQKSISSASLILAVSYFLSAVLGLLRDRLLAGTFGAGNELDVYYTAFTVPDLIASVLIFGAIGAAVIPIFSGHLIKDEKSAWRYISVFMNIFLGFLIAVCVILIIATPWLISFIAPGFSGEKREVAIAMMQIMFLSPIILGASNMISGVLQVFHRFFITALAPLMYNIGIITGILIFAPRMGITGLAWGVVFGGILHLCVQLPSLFFSGFRYSPNFNVKDPSVVKTIQLMAPRSLGLGAGQLNTIATTAIASTLMAGSIAVFNLANNLSSIFVNAVAVSISTAAFPAMSMNFIKQENGEFLRRFSSIIRQIIFLTIPLSLLLLILRAQVVRVILGAGRFDWSDTRLTTACLAVLAINLIAQALILFLSKSFYAACNTKIPAVISVVTVGLNITLSLLFVWLIKTFTVAQVIVKDVFRLEGMENIAVMGLALAYSITALAEAGILFKMFCKKFPEFNIKEILDSLNKVIIASFIMFILTFATRQLIGVFVNLQNFWAVFFQLVMSGTVGVAVFIFVSHLQKSTELQTIKDSFLKKFLSQ
jgi:putative peptidoglycan lipid II flippase